MMRSKNVASRVLCASGRTGMTGPATPCHSLGIGNDQSLLVKLTTDRPYTDAEKAA